MKKSYIRPYRDGFGEQRYAVTNGRLRLDLNDRDMAFRVAHSWARLRTKGLLERQRIAA